MTLSFRLRSGTYKPMAAESTPPRPSKTIKCAVRLLDDSQQMIELEKSAVGQILVDRLFDCLDLAERDYFGLQLLDPHQDIPGVIKWIEADKKIRKQFKTDNGVFPFLFRVKFYTPDPCRLHEEYTRYHFFMQLKLDIAERRLWVDEEAAILLASYAVQSELGDYNPTEHRDGYVTEFKYFSPDVAAQIFEQRVVELHKQHRGQSPADAEFNFLYHARSLETYGVVIFEVVPFPPTSGEEPTPQPYNADQPVFVGVSAVGLTVFRGGRRVLTHPWCNICKVSFKRRQFLLSVVHETNDTVVVNGGGKSRFHHNNHGSFAEGNGMISADGTREFMQHAVFTLNNPKLARSLWQTAVEYHTFFRLKSPPAVTKSAAILAPFNVAFRYSGRTEFQGMEDLKRKMRTVERPFSRASFNRYARRTVSTALPVQNHQNNRFSANSQQPSLGRSNNKGATSPTTNGSASTSGATTNGSSWLGRSSFGFGIVNVTPPKSNGHASNGLISSAANGNGTVNHSRTISTPTTLSSPGFSSLLNGNGHHLEPPLEGIATQSPSATAHQNGGVPGRKTVPQLSSQHLLGIPEKIEDLPFYEEPQGSNTSSSVLSYQQQQQQRYASTNSPQPVANSVSNALPHRSLAVSSSSQSSAASPASSGNSFSVPLVTIRLKPDADGRFGFNVKGGVDQQMAVMVSRVAPNTPADRAIPRLREGDLLLSINGRDPNAMLHDEVVNTIRTSREEATGDLVLVVRPQLQVPTLDLQQASSPPHNRATNGFVNGATRPTTVISGSDSGVVLSTPPTYRPGVPTQPVSSNSSVVSQPPPPPVVDGLQKSIQDLRDSLVATGSSSLVTKFEKLERRNSSMVVSVATYAENLAKNRYRDITPYDETRVKIKNRPNGDYINASHVNMEIPGAGVVNRYICCQGPLPHTCADFWQMVWEQQSTLVVMLTAQMEQGMVKCHQYWPSVNDTCKYENLQVSCLRETVLTPASNSQGGIIERQLSLINRQTSEERDVTQLQYMAWPDHGVPDEPRSFIDFVQRVRSLRAGTVEPTVVHCSAGIGRTGVILLVETAMSLVEARQPVDPVEIVRRLRCQRAMLVQNASQFVFACQAILKVFDDKIVTPLGENGADSEQLKYSGRR